jgi:cAMP-dependent protein kinase regulator
MGNSHIRPPGQSCCCENPEEEEAKYYRNAFLLHSDSGEQPRDASTMGSNQGDDEDQARLQQRENKARIQALEKQIVGLHRKDSHPHMSDVVVESMGRLGNRWMRQGKTSGSLSFAEPSSLYHSDDYRQGRATIVSPLKIDWNEDHNYTPPVYPKTQCEIEFLDGALQRNSFLFSDLNATTRRTLVMAMERQDVLVDGTRVIQQGDTTSEYFYILQQGCIEFLDHDAVVGSLSSATSEECSFGELALLYDTPRAVSCVARWDAARGRSENGPVCVLWKLDRHTFRWVLAQASHDIYDSIRSSVRNSSKSKMSSMFAELDESTLSKLVQAMTVVHWKANDKIIIKGEIGHVMYYIAEGTVRVHDIGLGDSVYADNHTLTVGDWFGERALLLEGEPRVANVTAVTDVSTMALDRSTLESSLGPLQSLLQKRMKKMALQTLPIFASTHVDENGKNASHASTACNVSEYEFNQLADLMTEACYREGEYLVKANEVYPPYLWIIQHGQVLVFKGVRDDGNTKKTHRIYNLQSGE